MFNFRNKSIKSFKVNLNSYGLDDKIIIKETLNKNSYLKLNRKNEIVFLKSKFMTKEASETFLLKNIGKFLNQQRINLENKPYNLEVGWVILFGNYFNLFYGGPGRKYNISGKNITVYGTTFQQAFKNFCKHQSLEIIKLAENISKNTTYKPIFKVKLLVAVWGNCNPKLNTISLNEKLLFFRKEVIEYVIYHELSHYTYQNHQKDFWNLVGEYCPNYKILKKELKNW